jgi:hypothetical protein
MSKILFADDLIRILPPPRVPVDPLSSIDLERAETKLGPLPDDYKWFLRNYGSGRIDGFLFVLNPSSRNPHLNLLDQVSIRLDALKELATNGSEKIPYPLFPEPHGVLPFAATENGDVLFWKKNESVETWNVVVNDSRSPEWQEFSCGMVELLVKLLTSEIRCKIFPPDFPSSAVSFYVSGS